MPGCGKSTLGKLLAHKIGYKFVDCDRIIESCEGKLQQIIETHGDDEFLAIEEATLLSLKGRTKVFSPGGSCVLSPSGMLYVRQISLVVFIDVPLRIIERRLMTGNIDSRGIIGLKNMTLNELFDYRRPLHERYTHLVVILNDTPVRGSLDILLNKMTDYRRQ
jgi:shikimate kinase